MKELKLYKSLKPLCHIDEKNILVYKKLKLFKFNFETETLEFIFEFKVSILKKYIFKIRLFERILRLEPRVAIKQDKFIFISFKGYVYKLDVKTNSVVKIHEFREGMSSTLSFSKIKNVDTVDSGIYYGEYFSNNKKEEVSIYKYISSLDSFEIVFTFEKGLINHVHQIVEDEFRNRVWIMTGDFEDAAAIWYTDDNFKNVNLFLCGNQKYRACKVFVSEEGLIYGTDTPLEQNYIYSINIDKNNFYEEKLYELSGSVIYGTELDSKYIISTTVENHYYEKFPILSLFTWKRAAGIKSWNVSIMSIDKKSKDVEIIYTYRKDMYPIALCQFGAIQFLDNNASNNLLIFYGSSLKGFDNKMGIVRI